jgi:hypothetical protein
LLERGVLELLKALQAFDLVAYQAGKDQRLGAIVPKLLIRCGVEIDEKPVLRMYHHERDLACFCSVFNRLILGETRRSTSTSARPVDTQSSPAIS